MARRGSGDGLHFDATADFGPARRETDELLKKLRGLGTVAVDTGKKIDKSTVDSAKGYRQLANEITQAQVAENALTRSVEQTRAARARSAMAQSNARVATGTEGSRVAKSQGEADLAAARAATEQERKRVLIRQQGNRDLESQSRASLMNDKREDIHQQQILRAERERNKLVRQRQADEERARRQAERAQQQAERAEQKRVRQQQDMLYGQYMDGQRSYDKSNSTTSLNATRYALYDIAGTATIVGGAILSIGAYSVLTATKFETSFASVQRAAQLTGGDISKVRGQLIDLSTEIQASFENIAIAATLGAQMDIAGEDLDKFSSVVTRFSATTNASVDTTAQSFGRIGNLLDVPATKFENLGSAIYAVGIQSVATETEILSTSQQIAGAASAYNFTAQEVVGLGAAFASLAIAPEAARGSVTRIFGDIEKAVAGGGDELAEYARLMHLSVEETAMLWKDRPSDFFNQLVQGLSQSKSLLEDLYAIGANDVRDVNLLQRLAGNPEILAKSIEISNAEFAEGTALGEAYAIQADTLGAKLQVLGQTFQALAAGGGALYAEGLKPLVDILQYLVDLIATQPIFATVVAGAALFLGSLILIKGAQAAAIAGLLAFRVVLKNVGSDAVITGINLKALQAVMAQVRAEAGIGSMSVDTFGKKVAGAGSAVLGFGKVALKGIAGVGLVVAGLELLDMAVDAISYNFLDSAGKAERYFGELTGFSDAVKADTKAYEETGAAVATYTKTLKGVAPEVDATATAVDRWLGLQDEAASRTRETTGALTEQTVAFGANTTAWIKDALSKQEGIKKLANDPKMLADFERFGGNIDDLIAAGLKGNADAYLDGLAKKAIEIQDRLGEDAGGQTYQDFSALSDTISPSLIAIDELIKSEREAANTTDFLGAALVETSDDAVILEGKMNELKAQIDAVFSGVSAESEFGAALNELYAGLAEGGTQFSAFTDAGRTNFDNLQESIFATANYASTMGTGVNESLVPLFMNLQQQGVDTDALLRQLASNPITFQAGIDISAVQAGIASLGGSVGNLNPRQIILNNLMTDMAANAKKAAKQTKGYGGAAGGAAKQVRTLSDYVSDLNTTFDKAFGFRFGLEESLDDVRSKWNDIAKAQRDAVDSLRDYLVELEQMKAEKGVLEYQLTVAVEYGNTVREQQIRAELAKLNADMADKQKQVDEATAGANRTLIGNTDAAIDNRAEIRDLLKSYEAYIGSLANTGLSQAQLAAKVKQAKADFLAQAAALGYNTGELGKYTRAFDDMVKIVNKLPRDITVKANTDPAQRAIDELIKKNTGGSGLSGGFSAPVKLTFNDEAIKKAARGMALLAEYNSLLNSTNSGKLGSGLLSKRALEIKKILSSGNYAQGGFVPWAAPGDKRKDNGFGMLPDGRTVGLQGGEPIINNAARAKYGDRMFNDINALQYRPPAAVSVKPVAGSPDYMIAEGGPKQLALLRQIAHALENGMSVTIGDREIGQAAERYNHKKSRGV